MEGGRSAGPKEEGPENEEAPADEEAEGTSKRGGGGGIEVEMAGEKVD